MTKKQLRSSRKRMATRGHRRNKMTKLEKVTVNRQHGQRMKASDLIGNLMKAMARAGGDR